MRESIRAAASPLRVAPPLHKTFTAAYRQAATESASGAAYRRRGMFAIRPRRALLVVSAAALLTFRPSAYAADVPLTQFVNPFIGTQGAPNTLEGGNTTPAAMVPFGMVQLGPDTTTGAGGYRFSQTTIREFSMTRYSGRAFATWLDVSLMPFVGFTSSLPSPGTNWTNYSQAYTHGAPNEEAEPGFYHVHLDTKNID